MPDRIANERAHGRRIAARAEEIWNWSGEAGRRRWERRVRFIAERLPQGARVLEVGCGTGLLTDALAERGIPVVAIDVSPDLIARARTRTARRANVALSVQNAYAAAIRDGAFDAIVGISVLHHLDLAAALAEFRRVLRPGGKLLFSEPNMANPIILAVKNIAWLKRRAGDSPDETAFFRAPLSRSLRAAGFEPLRVEPFDFLHPSTPAPAVPAVDWLSARLERVPLLREIAGSLLIEAVSVGA
jgi:2-polyprenyl-3-methyl-5-hydroxy-6-metoxy-1,4-benzoquinol methylase